MKCSTLLLCETRLALGSLVQKGPQGEEAQKQQEWNLKEGIYCSFYQTIALIKKKCVRLARVAQLVM